MSSKNELYERVVLVAKVYGPEVWGMREKIRHKLFVTDIRCLNEYGHSDLAVIRGKAQHWCGR